MSNHGSIAREVRIHSCRRLKSQGLNLFLLALARFMRPTPMAARDGHRVGRPLRSRSDPLLALAIREQPFYSSASCLVLGDFHDLMFEVGSEGGGRGNCLRESALPAPSGLVPFEVRERWKPQPARRVEGLRTGWAADARVGGFRSLIPISCFISSTVRARSKTNAKEVWPGVRRTLIIFSGLDAT
jgi:hypothetical protein